MSERPVTPHDPTEAPLGADFFDSAYRQIFAAISDGVYVTDDQREILYWNSSAERITGFPADEAIGQHCYDELLIHTDATGRRLCFDGCPLQDCIEHGVERSIGEVYLKRKDGERLPVYVKTSSFVYDKKTYGVEIFGELASVAGKDLAAQVQRLTDSSVADPLTSLFNRRYADVSLEQHFDLFTRMGQRYGVLYLDIDQFKDINDTLGHAAGDSALVFVSSIIADNARSAMDIVARYGGDEFIIICSVASAEELEKYAQRLNNLVQTSSFPELEGTDLRLTVSIGGALADFRDPSGRQVLERADTAMYEVKAGGRNSVAIHRA